MSGQGTCPRALALRPHRLIPPLPARLSSAASALSLAPCPRHCTASSSCQCSWACSAWTVNRYTPHLHGSCTATARATASGHSPMSHVTHPPTAHRGTRTEWARPHPRVERSASRIQQAAESRRPCVLARILPDQEFPAGPGLALPLPRNPGLATAVATMRSTTFFALIATLLLVATPSAEAGEGAVASCVLETCGG